MLLLGARRVLRALIDFLVGEGHARPLCAAVVLRKCLERGAGWHDDSQAEARQLEGIGPVLGQRLREAKAGS